MKQKKKLLYLSIIALLVLPCMVFGGAKLIGNITNYMSDANDGGASSSVVQDRSCIVGDSTNNALFDVRDLVRLERCFAGESISCSIDGDWNVSGGLTYVYEYKDENGEPITDENGDPKTEVRMDTEDAEICFRMLVEDMDDNKQWQEVTTTESTNAPREYKEYYNKFIDIGSEFAYYTLNKDLKQGWVLTFKVDLKDNESDCQVSVYYPGCEDWLKLGTQSTSENGKVFSVVATEDIAMSTLKIRVENSATQVLTAFRVYDIQIIKHTYVDDLEIVYVEEGGETGARDQYRYNQAPEIPIVYGTKDALNMERFEIQTDTEGLNYNWTLSYEGEPVDNFSKDNTAYTFSQPGTYTLTAKVVNKTEPLNKEVITNHDKQNFSGEVSTTITVLADPSVYINFEGKTVKNIVNGNEPNKYPIAGAYKINDTNDGFVPSVDAQYAKGIEGVTGSALQLRHDLSYKGSGDSEEDSIPNGAYAVVKDYQFETDDFTIATWFRVQTEQENNDMVSQETNTYLFGIADPNASDGFSVCLNPDKLIIKVNNSSQRADISYVAKEWNYIVLRREGKNIEAHLNGKLVCTFTSNEILNFNVKDLAFGGYYGFFNRNAQPPTLRYYHKNLMCYDDIQVYSGDLSNYDASVILSPKKIMPDVEVGYNNGAIENTGTNKNATASKYELKDKNFDAYTGKVEYTVGIHGDTNGAIVTNHANGPYTVIKGHSLGTDDFTISTWFNIPDVNKLSAEKYTYIFGTANPNDTANGFAAYVKADGQIYMSAGNDTERMILEQTVESNTWYHLVVRRFGTEMRVYLNGTKDTDIFKTIDYKESVDIAFGAYAGIDTSSYVDDEMYFDEIKVYGGAISEAEITDLYNEAHHEPDVYVDFDGETVNNEGKLSHIEVRTARLLHEDRGDIQYEPNDDTNKRQQGAWFSANGTVRTFDTGYHGQANSAIKAIFRKGPYTVVRDYVFGKDNFTLSARFKMETMVLHNSANTYLFGSDHPDAEEGFSVGLKRNEGGAQQIRIRILDEEYFISLGFGAYPELVEKKWYQIMLVRDGDFLRVYLDDVLLKEYGLPQTDDGELIDFGTSDLSFGGYPGFKYLYNGQTVYYDDITLYEGAVVSGVSESVYKTNLIEPAVEITYEKGTIKNTGYDRRPTVGAYDLEYPSDNDGNDKNKATSFIEPDSVTYATGIDGDANGAIDTHHQDGAYTVVDGFDIGRSDFTISTWFKMPTVRPNINDESLVYLFGVDEPDGALYNQNSEKNTFSVGIKINKDNNGKKGLQQIRLRVDNTTRWIGFTEGDKIFDNTWHHIALVREGTALKIYLDGIQQEFGVVGTNFAETEPVCSISPDADYGTVDLAFGGYTGYATSYKAINTQYDDVRVYSQALVESYIVNVARIGKFKSAWLEKARDGETTLFIGDEFFAEGNQTVLDTAYVGKDVVFAGITGSKIGDWGVLVDRYLSLTRPRNLVVHLGANDIKGGTDAETIAQNLQTFFMRVHELGNYKATKIYYFGIEDIGTHTDVVTAVNNRMRTWCQDASRSSWITFVEPVASVDGVKTALDATSIKIQTLPTDKIPKVEITYSGGAITNIGSDRTVTAGAYNIASGEFKSTATEDANYTTGVDGDASGAIITNHKTGPYTVVKGYNFGTNDFTISTMFKLDKDAILYNDAGTYLFGIAHPGDNEGFAICIKRYTENQNNTQQFRVMLPGQTEPSFISLQTSTGDDKVLADTWYRLTVVREGASIKIYLNDTELKTYTISADVDFGTPDLAFGAYPGGTTVYHSTKMYYDDIKVYDKAYEVEELFEYGEIYSGFANEGTYPFVLFNENGECFNNRGCKTFADALHAAKQEMLNNVWDPESKTYGDNPRKVYILLRRDYETSSVEGQWETDSTYGNWAQARGEIVIDLGGHTIKQKTSSSILRGVVSKRDGTVFPSTYTIINGKFKVTSEPLFTMQTWENKGEGTLAEKLFTFNFKNVEIGFDENATANNLLFSYYDWSPNEGALEPTKEAPFVMNFEDCIFDMKTNAPTNTALTLFNIATTTAKWIKNTVTVEGGKIITNALGEGEYPTHLIVDTDATLAENNGNAYGSSVTFVKDDQGEYTKFELNSGTLSHAKIFNKDGVELSLLSESVDETNSIYKFKLVEQEVVEDEPEVDVGEPGVDEAVPEVDASEPEAVEE